MSEVERPTIEVCYDTVPVIGFCSDTKPVIEIRYDTVPVIDTAGGLRYELRRNQTI